MELLERFARELEAFESFFRLFKGQVHNWTVRLVRDRAVAEDLTVERALRGAPRPAAAVPGCPRCRPPVPPRAHRLHRHAAGGLRSPRRVFLHALSGVAQFVLSAASMLVLWPPFPVQVITMAAAVSAIVILQIRGWPSFGRAMLLYALASRVPVVILMLFAIFGSWGTHYDAFPPGFPPPSTRWRNGSGAALPCR